MTLLADLASPSVVPVQVGGCQLQSSSASHHTNGNGSKGDLDEQDGQNTHAEGDCGQSFAIVSEPLGVVPALCDMLRRLQAGHGCQDRLGEHLAGVGAVVEQNPLVWRTTLDSETVAEPRPVGSIPAQHCVFSGIQSTDEASDGGPIFPCSTMLAERYARRMEKRSLGNAGVEVSVFGLGTMTFGAESDEATSHAILDTYFEAGGRFVDTADVYTKGASEEIIGRWLRSRGNRDDVVIATKGRFAMGEGPENQGASRVYLERALEASMARLGVDHVDVYQVHAWDPATPLEETLETLHRMVETGRVGAIGVSNFSGWQLERAIVTARYEGWTPLVSLQPQYNLLSREIEWDLVPVCLEEGLGLLPWSPLGGGWLTGKYSREDRPEGATRLGEDPGRGIEAYDLKNTERTWRILDVVQGIATQRGVTMSQVALNWVRSRPGVSSVLLGCRNTRQLDDNLAAVGWQLTGEELEALNRVSAPGMPLYPYGFLESYAGMDVWERLGTRTEPLL